MTQAVMPDSARMATDISSLGDKRLAWLMLTRRMDAPITQFLIAARRETGGLRAAAPPGWDVRLRLLVDEGNAVASSSSSRFDAIVTISGSATDFYPIVTNLCAGFSTRMSAELDSNRSGALAGTPLIVRPGSGRYMNMFCLRPSKGRTLAGAREYWRTTHRQIAQDIKGGAGSDDIPTPSYAQLHADDDATRALGESAGLALTDFFGAALNFVDDVNWIARVKERSNAASAASLDVPNFIDTARSPRALYDLAGG